MNINRNSPPRLRKVQGEHGLADTFRRLSLSSSEISDDKITPNPPNIGRRIANRLKQAVQPGGQRWHRSTDVRSLVAGSGNSLSESIVEWNTARNIRPITTTHIDVPSPLNVRRVPTQHQVENTGRSRNGGGNEQEPTTCEKHAVRPVKSSRSSMPQSTTIYTTTPPSLNKPLPPLPHEKVEGGHTTSNDHWLGTSPIASIVDVGDYRHTVEDIATPDVPVVKSLETDVGNDDQVQKVLQNSERKNLLRHLNLSEADNVEVHQRQAPAVVHTSTVQETHNIHQEHITREIHEHYVYPHVLPITETEVLPARHYVPTEGGYMEIAEEEVPESFPNTQDRIRDYLETHPRSTVRNLNVEKLTTKDVGEADIVDQDEDQDKNENYQHGFESNLIGSDSVSNNTDASARVQPLYYQHHPDKGIYAIQPFSAENIVGVSPILQARRAGRVDSLHLAV